MAINFAAAKVRRILHFSPFTLHYFPNNECINTRFKSARCGSETD